MSHISIGKKLFFLALLVVVALIGLRFSAHNNGQLTPLASAMRDFLAPVQRVLTQTGQGASKIIAYPVQLVQAQKQNQELKDKIIELEGKLLKHKEIQAENTRLKQLLEFKTDLTDQVTVVTGVVINRDTDNWLGSMVIDIGAQKGIAPDMAVITPAGLVGRVVRVSEQTAEVLLITDPRSGVGVLIQDNRGPGIVEGVAGGQGELRMMHIPADLAPQKGSVVVTSGLGSVFPKGVPVGVVQQVRKEKSGLFMMADVAAYVDFNQLEEVMVITSFHPGAH